MIIVERAARFEASAERMWKLFDTEEGQIRAERGFVSAIEFEGQGLGMVRTMRTEGHLADGYVKEKLVHYDPDRMEMTFEIIDTGDIVPFAGYLGSARVIPAGPDACILLARSTFTPLDYVPEEQARAMSEANYRLFFDNLREALASGEY
ncbi:SRPBCC family protein [Sphingosinicella rhizophila]|uniref:SRPBCC family protein n=1 Tax=Sphingosinicella rhizophila TaxID=3050082 RepID=A0ABU3Q6X3_9SPHN|nr:SRPBCC family protein [Sphingosinicella sp. GR2756]MDT9599139.1 SRPBCC family protein [Sphingosinicella sp. GR2756]